MCYPLRNNLGEITRSYHITKFFEFSFPMKNLVVIKLLNHSFIFDFTKKIKNMYIPKFRKNVVNFNNYYFLETF